MKTQLIYFMLLLIYFCFFSSCKNKKVKETEVYTTEINIRKSLQQKKMNIPLSNLTEEIKYIPLETNDSCLLHGIYRLMLADEHIFASDGLVLYQFDLSGRFVRQIGRQGRGPGEHSGRIKVDVQNENVFILSSGIMNIYDLETASFKRSFKIDFEVSDFAVTADNNILFFTVDLPAGPLSFTESEVYITDNEGNITNSIINHSRLNNNTQSIGYVNLYRRNEQIKYMYNFRDTLYSITENSIRRPSVIFKLENSINRDNIIMNPFDNSRSVLHDFIWVQRITENDNYVFITMQKGFSAEQSDVRHLLYDITNSSLSSTTGFVNDIDAGMPFWPQFSIENTLIDHYQPHQIIDYYESTIGTVNHSESFVNFVKKLKENDNPVLVFIKVKKH